MACYLHALGEVSLSQQITHIVTEEYQADTVAVIHAEMGAIRWLLHTWHSMCCAENINDELSYLLRVCFFFARIRSAHLRILIRRENRLVEHEDYVVVHTLRTFC